MLDIKYRNDGRCQKECDQFARPQDSYVSTTVAPHRGAVTNPWNPGITSTHLTSARSVGHTLFLLHNVGSTID